MPTIDVPLIDASPSLSSPSVGVPTAPVGVETAPTYQVVGVNLNGTPQVNLDNVEPDTIETTLNAPDDTVLTFAKGAYTDSDIDVLLNRSGSPTEFQVYRNSDLLTWGPCTGITASGSQGAVTAHINGVDWYLNRLFLDGIIPNLIDNPDFESGTGSWTNHNVDTFSTDSATFETGTVCAKLQNSSSEDAYIQQTHVVAGRNLGRLMTLSAWLYIDSFVEPAFGTRGLYIEGVSGLTSQINNYYPIDNATPRGTWQKLTTTIWVPPNQTWNIVTRLYSPHGVIRWDDVKLSAMDSVDAAGHTGITLVSEDIAHIVSTIITHVQDSTVGKFNLRIAYHTPTTGTKLIKVYQYVDHVQFDQALLELLSRNDGVDYFVSLTPTTRTFTTFVNKRGVDWSDVVIKFDADDLAGSNTTDYRLTRDGGQCITRETTLGQDNGPTREQGEASDASSIGGIILQDVHQAPQDAVTNSLQPLADERIARYSAVPDVIEMDVKGDWGAVPILKCGDLVTIFINDGWVQRNAIYRIMKTSLKCATNIFTLTVTKDSL